jgi:hypothetical protein
MASVRYDVDLGHVNIYVSADSSGVTLWIRDRSGNDLADVRDVRNTESIRRLVRALQRAAEFYEEECKDS